MGLTCSNRTLCNQSHICKHAKTHERRNSCNKCGIYEQLCVEETKNTINVGDPQTTDYGRYK